MSNRLTFSLASLIVLMFVAGFVLLTPGAADAAAPVWVGNDIQDKAWNVNDVINETLREATDDDNDPITYSISPDLPAGVTFIAATRTLIGVPTNGAASQEYTYTATAGGQSITDTFNIKVNSSPVFDPATLVRYAKVGANRVIQLPTATDEDGDSLTYSITAGTLPPGLNLFSDLKQIKGIPTTAAAAANITWTASDGNNTGNLTVAITVEADFTPVISGTTSDIAGVVGTAISSVQLPTATKASTNRLLKPDKDGNDQYETITYSLDPSLPAGLQLSEVVPGVWVLSGTPSAAKDETEYTWSATDPDGDKGEKKFKITINATTPPPAGTPGAPTGLTATANQTAKTIALSWTAPTDNGGSAITGYTITQSQTGVADVTATSTTTSHTTGVLTAGTYSFTVAATNANGTGTATAAVSATIDDAVDDGDPLTQPTNVMATAQGDGSIMVTWAWAGANATETAALAGFTVNWNPSMDVAADQRSYTIPAAQLTAGQSTTVSVLARATAGSDYSTPTAGSGAPSAVTPVDPTALKFVDAAGAVVTSLDPLTLTAGTAIGTTAMPYIQLPQATGGVGDITYTLRKGLGERDVTSGDNGLMVNLTELRLHGTPAAAAAVTQYQWRATDARGEGDAKGVKKLNFTITVNAGVVKPTVTILTSPPTTAVKDEFVVAFTTTGTDVTVTPTISVAPSAAATAYTFSPIVSETTQLAVAYTITQAKSKVARQATPAGTVTLTLTPRNSLGTGTPAMIVVPFAERPFDAADWDITPPTVVVGDVADDQSDPFEVRFSVTDTGNASGVTNAAGLDADGDGDVTDDITVTILGPAKAAKYSALTEARPDRLTNSIGDITFASFSMMIAPTRPENRVGIRIQVKATDRAGNIGMHEISVTLGPKEFIPVVTSNPNIISCLTGSTITVTFDRKLAAGEKVIASEIFLSNPDLAVPDNVNKVEWEIVPGSITDPSFNNVPTSPETTVQFKVRPKSNRDWVGQTRLQVDIAPGAPLGVSAPLPAVKDLGANTNAGNKHGKKTQKDSQGFPIRFGTFTIGPVLTIPGNGYIAVVRDKEALGYNTMDQTHLNDTTLIVADKAVRAGIPDVQGWECMPDLGVLLGIAPYQDKENDRGSSTRLAVTGGGGIIVKESPEQGSFDALDLTKGSVGISEMMWAVDRSKLFGAASNVRQAQEQWIELHNLNSADVHVTLFDLILDEAYATNKYDELDRMSNFNSPTGTDGRWAIRTDEYKKGRDGDSDYGRDFVAMQKADIPTAAKNYAHKDSKKGTSKDGWKASAAVYLTRTSALAGTFQLPYGQLNYDFIGTPARKNTLDAGGPGVVERTNVPHKPVIFNEIANRTNANRYYEWIELRNVDTTEINLRNYNISYITAVGTETTLYEFPNNDNIKIAAEGILLLVDTDPKNREDHPVAMDNPEVKYVVTDFSGNGLPDDGEFVLVLRHPEGVDLTKPETYQNGKGHDKPGTAKAKQGTHERIVDLIGYDSDLASPGADLYTGLWPLKVFSAPDARNKLEVETVHHRQHVIAPDKNTHNDDKDEHQALRDAGYTGIGYKRLIPGIAAHGGTPGYDNGVAKEYNDGDATVSAAPVTISEVMYHTDSGRLPQWIELYNSSMTEVVRVEDWTLQLENADDVSIRTPRVSVKLAAKLIQPNQTILIVASTTGNNSDHFPDARVIDIWTNGLKDKDRLEIETDQSRRSFKILSETSFRITLKDKAGKVVDAVGNFGADTAWDLPKQDEDGNRSSLIRRYDKDVDGKGVARDGTMYAVGKDHVDSGWVLAASSELYETHDDTYYGNITDIGSPGYRGGGPLPVSLSKFRPERLDDGSIVVRWITESELNNAGFNILRSETKDGEYTKLNTQLIAGQGTTSERTSYTFADTSAKPNAVYYYQIQDVSLDGKVNTLRVNRLKGHISAADKLTTTWGELKALQ